MAKKGVKEILVQIISGANIVTALLMVLIGYSYLVNPMTCSLIGPVGLSFPFFLLLNVLFLVFWLFFHWKKAYLPILAFIVCYFPVRTYMGINANADVPQGAIKVMSYNVLGFHGQEGSTLSADSNAVALYIYDEDCDIVCLQEANEGYLDDNTKNKLHERYPFHREDVSGTGNRMAIYSKYEIVAADTIPYESESGMSVVYTLQYKDKEVLVINNHLERSNLSIEEREKFSTMMRGNLDKHEAKQESKSVYAKLAESSVLRASQAQAVAEFIEEHQDKVIVLMGDFNDNPISYTHYAIAKNLRDCFIESGKGLGWTYCHHAMRVRIDNIMCSKELVPYQCEVDNKLQYSDHFPIKCWIKID